MKMLPIDTEKKLLIHWSAWFYLGHVLFFWMIGLNYFFAVPSVSFSSLMDDFVLLSFVGHLAVLALSPCLFVWLLIFIFPYRRLVFVIASLIAALASSLLVLDAIVYNLYHYHLNITILTLAFHGITKDILGLSFREKIIPIFIILVFLMIELCYARWLWHTIKTKAILHGWFKYIFVMLALLVYSSYIMIVIHMNPLWLRNYIEKTRFLPFYDYALSVVMPKNKESLAFIRIDNKDPLRYLNSNNDLAYPKNTLQFKQKNRLLNLVIIGIDSWRFDMLNQEVTPGIFKFSKKSWVFNQHISGGNSTGPGIFSLFYGLPANYTLAMESQHRSPVLIEALLAHHYQMGVFSSAPLYMPPINKSVFQHMANLQNESVTASTVLLRDQSVTRRFAEFIQHRDSNQPFFSFLFFDAAHSYCGTDIIPGPFQPTATRCNRLTFNKKRDYQEYLNRYKNAVLTVDAEVNQVINILQSSNLLKNTVVMIVGDHGEEFDDGNKGFYGHASNFGRYQVQTPLVMYWPGEKPKSFHHKTSHFDVAPTLMAKLLGCLNKPSDYALGTSLLDSKLRPYFIISSYVDFGVIEPERITTIYSVGNYHIEKPNGDAMDDSIINIAMMRKVFDELHYFYRGQ